MHIYSVDSDTYSRLREGTGFLQLNRGIVHGTGADRLDLLHRLSTGDVGRLKPMQEGTTILTTEKGRIIDVLQVVALENEFFLILRVDDSTPVLEWLDRYTIMDDFNPTDVSKSMAVIGVYGDGAGTIARRLFDQPIPANGTVIERTSESGNRWFLTRGTGLNGPFAAHILLPSEDLSSLKERLREEGTSEMSDEAWNIMRIEAGQPGAGTELGEEYNPLEAGLISAVSFTKGCYIGQEVISRLDSYDKVKRRLTGLRIADLSTDATEVSRIDLREPVSNETIGSVTSLAHSPTIGTIGLGFIRSAHSTPDLPVLLTTGEEGREIGTGTISMLPFDN